VSSPDTSPETNGSTTEVGCECIEQTDKLLAEHNTRLGLNFQWDRKTGVCTSSIAIQTEIVTKKRGARPMALLATFCPICSRRYLAAPPAEATGEVQS
jgi:hypothetical protein